MRHAVRYWLGVQANRAIETASRIHFESVDEEVKDEIEKIDTAIPSADIEALVLRHGLAISEAARAITKAELFHREIVRRGGQLR